MGVLLPGVERSWGGLKGAILGVSALVGHQRPFGGGAGQGVGAGGPHHAGCLCPTCGAKLTLVMAR